jgi:hypothetical protein
MLYKLRESTSDHYYELNVWEQKIKANWEARQLNNSQQVKFTSLTLALRVLEKLGDLNGKDVLVFANLELYILLKTLKNVGITNFKTITFMTDIESLEGKDDIIVVNFNKLSDINIDMIYDIALANPPYNLESSSTEGNHKKKTKFIGKDFIEWLPTIAKESAIICPTKGYWTGKNRNSTSKRLKKLGLYSVEATEAFKDTANLDGIAVYYFSKDFKGEVADDFAPAHIIPENNLGDLLVYGSNDLIGGAVKQMNFAKGTDTLYITAKRDVLENVDLSTFPDPTKGKWRVILSQNGGKEKYGVPRLIKPNDGITYSVVCFPVDSEDIGNRLIEYLNEESTKELAASFRVSNTNSKHNFSAIKAPDFLV